jgi:epoxyqueuosine reductase
MKEAIRRRAWELGFDDCRVTTAEPPGSATQFHQWLERGWHGQMAYLQRNAAKRVEPARVLPGAKSIVALAMNYAGDERPITSENRHLPRALANETAKRTQLSGVIARYARFADYHDILGQRLEQLAVFINRLGGPATRSLWYVDTGPVLERDLAQRAGLGFIGKHTNVISRHMGNWISLSEILTTLELQPDLPEKNRCGSCSRCLSACPTGAIRAPFQLDARLCISYLTIELKGSIPIELRPAIGNRIFGCDDCLAACPWNRFARAGRLMQEHAIKALDAPDLLELLALDEAGFKRRFAGTPMLRAKRRGLLRNACVALGNTGDEYALPALQQASRDPDPLIAEHACWAIERIGTRMTKSQIRNSKSETKSN